MMLMMKMIRLYAREQNEVLVEHILTESGAMR